MTDTSTDAPPAPLIWHELAEKYDVSEFGAEPLPLPSFTAPTQENTDGEDKDGSPEAQ